MRFVPHLLASVCLILVPSFGQQSPRRDPAAVSVALQAYNALGGILSVDSRAQGAYDRTIGSSEDTGTIEILTRNYNQTSEELTSSTGTTRTVYSRGYGSQWNGASSTPLALEKSLASSSIIFPQVVIAPAVQDPNSTVLLIGAETVNGVLTNHIRICGSSPDQNFADIVSFATKDVWVATDSGLPIEISVQVFDSQGAPPVPVTAFFSNYRSVSGVLYPFRAEVWMNGTFYNSITISNVAFGVGLTDQDFPLR